MTTPGELRGIPAGRRRSPASRTTPRVVPDAGSVGKGAIHLVHLYPREMSIYGDLGNTRALAARLRRHGYSPVVHQHHPGAPVPRARSHLVSAAAARTAARCGSRTTSSGSATGCARWRPRGRRCS